MSNNFGRSSVGLVTACCALLCCAAFSGRGQSLVSVQDAQHFTSLGIDQSGALVILGDIENYEPALFEFTGTGFKITRLPALSGGEFPEAYRISRDARYVVGSCKTPELQDAAMLWLRSDVTVPRHLGTVDGSSSTYPRDVASTPDGPLIIGNSTSGAFVWTQAGGMRPWIPGDGHVLHPYLERVTEDGRQFVGEGFINGQIVPILGTETNFVVLDSRNGLGGALAISPNGLHICGHINLQSTVWRKGKPHILSLGTNKTSLLRTVTDHARAGGGSSAGGILYDSDGRNLELFDDWWTGRYPDVPLPGHVTSVQDLYEKNGNLYCLLRGEDGTSMESFSLLAIIPLKHRPKTTP